MPTKRTINYGVGFAEWPNTTKSLRVKQVRDDGTQIREGILETTEGKSKKYSVRVYYAPRLGKASIDIVDLSSGRKVRNQKLPKIVNLDHSELLLRVQQAVSKFAFPRNKGGIGRVMTEKEPSDLERFRENRARKAAQTPPIFKAKRHGRPF